ncbi:MAG: CoA pyrophosphatase [Vicinamibacterales bacterium]|nr:CoA pyrophosphatase [Vicinamibacterales bacterium]
MTHAPRLPAAFDALETRVHDALGEPLPGGPAHLGMAPRPRRPLHADEGQLRKAAGLLLIYPVDGRPTILLTERAGTLSRHGGQVSLPGGILEASETIEEAALREAFEECGVRPDAVRVLGGLTPIQIPVSRFLLSPIVGAASTRPTLRLDPGEVARAIEAPLDALMDPDCLGRQRQTRDGVDIDAPYFDLDGTRVWGATAMILSEFLHLLGYAPDPW